MRFPGQKTITQAWHLFTSKFTQSSLILGYHRVANPTNDLFSMCVTPEHFAQHVQTLARLANPIDLGALVKGLRDGVVPERAVVITFDDGYADVLYEAKPILVSHQVSATVFVTPGYLGREFWWDELARLLLFGELPAERPWPMVGEQINQCVMAASNQQSNQRSDQRFRLSVFHRLYNVFRFIHYTERERLLAQMKTVISNGNHRTPTHRALTSGELNQLTSDELIAIGAHTMNHAYLPHLQNDQQRSEVLESKRSLEGFLGKPIHGFAFPHNAYSKSAGDLLRQAGFQYACSGVNNFVSERSNVFQLSRFWIPDWDGAMFERWLKWWLN